MPSQETLVFQPVASKGASRTLVIALVNVGIICGMFLPIMVYAGELWLWVLGLLLISTIAALMGVAIVGRYRIGYLLTGPQLVLHWGLFKTRISCDAMVSVGKKGTGCFEGSRARALGLPGNLYGTFRITLDNGMQKVKLAGTDIANLVIIATKDGKYYGLTPASPENFIASLRQRVGGIAEKVY